MSTSTPISESAPKVGERFPDLTLPTQHGQALDLHHDRGSRKALVVFYRSARW